MSADDGTNVEPRRTRDAERTRTAILDAAADVFLGHGYRGASIRKVAAQAGVTHGTIYLYFRDKDDLLYQLSEEHFRQLLARLRALPRTLDPLARIREAFRTVVDYGLDAPDHYHLMLAMRPPHIADARERALGPMAAEVYSFLYDTVALAADRQLISADQVARDAWSLLAAAHGVVELHRAGVSDRDEALAGADRLIELLVRGLPDAPST